MNIQTKYFGSLTIDEKDIVQFRQGIPGFRECHTFVLIPLPDAPVYKVLQSTEDPNTAFVVTNPYIFFKNYEFEVDRSSKDELDLHKPEDVELYTVMTVNEPFNQSTVNLQAPIVMNKSNKRAKQLILNQSEYHTRHKIIPNEEAGAEHAHP